MLSVRTHPIAYICFFLALFTRVIIGVLETQSTTVCPSNFHLTRNNQVSAIVQYEGSFCKTPLHLIATNCCQSLPLTTPNTVLLISSLTLARVAFDCYDTVKGATCHYSFEFRVLYLLNWLPTMVRESSLLCYLIYLFNNISYLFIYLITYHILYGSFNAERNIIFLGAFMLFCFHN